jgi:hypothetical protein
MSDQPLNTGMMLIPQHNIEIRWIAFQYRFEFKSREYVEVYEAQALLANPGTAPYRGYITHESGGGAFTPNFDFDGADRFLDGSIRWDGCCHYYFGDEDGYLHLHGVRDTNAIATILRTVLDLAIDKVPAIDRELIK